MLDASVNFGNAKSAGRWIVGLGQKISWRGCFVWVYTTDRVDEPVAKHDTCDGQATVPIGIEVYLGGKEGLVNT